MLGYDAHVHEVRSGVSGDVTALTEVPHFCSAGSSGRRYTALV